MTLGEMTINESYQSKLIKVMNYVLELLLICQKKCLIK